MIKRIIFAVIAVFAAWSVLDFIIHGKLLMPTYEETKHLWRPMSEMKEWILHLVSVIAAVCVVLIYALFFKTKNIKNGLIYGLLLGIAWGISMGYGTYAYTPIPYFLAQAWFWATVVELTVAGLIVGLIVKE